MFVGMKNEYDKINGNIAFTESDHRYFDIKNPEDQYTSVTTLIHSFTQPFDKGFWSAYKALEKLIPKDYWATEKKGLLATKKFNKDLLDAYNISENDFNKTQQDILDEWDKKNKDSCERGTKIHSELENQYYKKPKDISLQKYGIGGKFECKRGYTPLDMECGIYPEYLIYRKSNDGYLKIAGQIDLLVKNGNDIWIIDYKGLPLDTKIPTIDGWSTMGELKEGDIIFDKDGNPTKIIHKSSTHTNPCYKITFDNGESIVADHEHRWLVSFITKENPREFISKIMTTEEIAEYLEEIYSNKTLGWYTVPRILNTKPLNLQEKELPVDPYVFGVFLAINDSLFGGALKEEIIKELKSRNCEVEGSNVITYKGKPIIDLLKNKDSIPIIYQRASLTQRLDLLRGFMDVLGENPENNVYYLQTSSSQLKNNLAELLTGLGIRVNNLLMKFEDQSIYGMNFAIDKFNQFLTIKPYSSSNEKFPSNNFLTIIRAKKTETVKTQCIEVDSPTHTYLCTEGMIVTHNTNQSIDMKSGFDTKTRKNATMLYPLNNLQDCNYYHYVLQLSTYAWMIQKMNPEFNIKGLILVHYGHDGNVTQYKLDYLKSDVEKMLAYFKKQKILEAQRSKRKRIEY